MITRKHLEERAEELKQQQQACMAQASSLFAQGEKLQHRAVEIGGQVKQLQELLSLLDPETPPASPPTS